MFTPPLQEAPLPDRATFDQLVRELVESQVPRLFAVVEEFGDRADARVAAWGLEHDARADVVSTEGTTFLVVGSAGDAATIIGVGEDVSALVVWLDEPDDDGPGRGVSSDMCRRS